MSALGATAAARADSAGLSVWRLRLRRFRSRRAGMAALAALIALVIFSLLAHPLELALGIDAFKADLLGRFAPPSAKHWLGSDDIGRDVLVRLMYAGQISLAIALIATAIGTAFGTTPKPRKLSTDSKRMTRPTVRVQATMIGVTTLGRICVAMT